MRWFLVIAILLSLALFFIINTPSPIKIEGDGVFYYSYLRSAMFDRDLDFRNELEYFSSYDYYSRQFVEENKLTPTGRTPNAYAWGTGLLWLPFILFIHLVTIVTKCINLISGCMADGFSAPYVWAVNFASWVYGMLALVLVFQILKKILASPSFIRRGLGGGSSGSDAFSRRKRGLTPSASVRRGNNEWIALLSSLAIWLATPWIYYQFFEPSMSHMASLFLVTGFLLLLVRQWKDQKVPAWLMVVTILLMIATRWQNAIFLLAFLPLIWRSKHKVREVLVLVVPIAVFAIIQMAIWKHLYGAYLLIPQGYQFVGYHFYGLRTLFSSDRGLFLWSPVIILAVIGWFELLKKSKFWAWMILAVGVGQWLINSSLNDPGGGDAFGARRFIELLPFLAVALAALLEGMRRFKWQMITLVVILILWNGLLIQNYRHNLIPRSGEFKFFQHNYFQIWM